MKKLFFISALTFFLSCSNSNDSATNTLAFVKLNIQTTNDLTDVYFYDNNNGVVSGTYGFLAKTDDAGKTWIPLNTTLNHSFLSAFMLNTNAIFTARLGVYGSSNGGNTFSQLGNLQDYSDSIFAIHFFNAQKGIIIKGRIILATNDGGMNWTIVNNEAEALDNLQFVSSTVGYASGGISYDGYSHGEIFKTTDGGLTWVKLISLSDSSEITSAYFIDASVGFYFDFQKQLFKTIDGGITWNQVENDNLDYSTSLVFVDANLGYSTTFNGKIIKTIDGGMHWTEMYNNIDVPLIKIIKTQNNTIFAVGNEGSVLKKLN